MSYANGTTFYNLPQTVGTDKRDWFDTNQAFADIDEALHGVVAGQSTDADNITNLQGRMTTAEGDITALQGRMTTAEGDISTLQGTVGTHTSQIADVRQDAEDMITAYNEGAAETSTHAYSAGDYFIYNDVLYKATDSIAIGDTIVPNTNCVATNVTTEVLQIISDLSDKTYNYSSILAVTTIASTDTTKVFSDLSLSNNKMYKLAFSISGAYYTLIMVGTTSSNVTIGDTSGPYYTNFGVTLNAVAGSLTISNKVLGSGWSSENLTVELYQVK